MKKRVLVGGLHHESDTFNPIVTGKDDIWVLRGETLLSHHGEDALSGEIDTLVKAGYEVIPTLVARAVPNGEWDEAYYLGLKNEILEDIKNAGHIDAFCLSLHGSMRVKGIGASEGDLLEAIRRLRPEIPIIASLDMHATITSRMVQNADGFVGYKTAPHVDEFETGAHAARIVVDMLDHGVKPVMSAVHVPFIVAGEQSETSVEPMKSLMTRLREIEKHPGILAASILLGFPWADTEENGVTALIVADNDKHLADTTSMELANEFWKTRKVFGFYNETRMPKDAINETVQLLDKGISPVVLSDSGDNPTAGSSQDVTSFLSLLLEDGRLCHLEPQLCYQGFYDPKICALSKEAGIGSMVRSNLGAKFDQVKSSPIPINAKVKAFVKAWPQANGSDLALLDIDGIDVVVTNKHVGCYDPAMMRALGVKPEACKVIIVKLGYLEPEIRAIARHSMMVLTTGSSDELFSRLPYRKMKRPVYPLDGDFTPDLRFIR
ncbi:MAG: M81 family metallopeptidase [Sphaerochaetaceae bacterium]